VSDEPSAFTFSCCGSVIVSGFSSPSSLPNPSAQPVSVSRSRAAGCITLAEFLQAKITSRLKLALCLTARKRPDGCGTPQQWHSLQTKDIK